MITTGAAALGASASKGQSAGVPWYARCYRWGQTNITEKDPERYDVEWWREQWKRTALQGVEMNAGGIVAYYPSKFPLHRRAQFLGNRDLLGELVDAAHRDGLAALARMDSSRLAEDFFRAHPDWFARTAGGQPVRTGDDYIPCINSPHREEYIPGILREIIERYRPEGFADNSWAGMGRDTICYCDNCARRFRDQKGKALPKAADWKDPVYRDWVRWSYARRLEIWELNNRVTKAAGGPDCIWVGSNHAVLASQSNTFRDTREIAKRTPLMLMDNQSRKDGGGFWQNTDDARYVHGLVGWNNFVLESMAMYQHGNGYFRVTSNPPAEARLWMLSGIAGGFQPKYHHIGADSLDRRMYQTAVPVMQWHKKNERYLVNRTPVATAGVVWSQSSFDFYGRDSAVVLAETPYRGMLHALYRTRIPCLPIHVDDIEGEADRLAVLVLPNVGSMSDQQCADVRRFVERGGSLIATGVTSLYDGDGEPRADFGLASVFGAHLQGPAPDRMFAMAAAPGAEGARGRGPGGAAGGRAGGGGGGRGGRGGAAAGAGGPTSALFASGGLGRGPATVHSYLRLRPELRASVFGPHISGEPHDSGVRHPTLAGFEETNLLPFGGSLIALGVDPDRSVLCTYVPPFPQLPTDAVWMRQERTDLPGLIVGSYGKGKVAFLPADLDRRYGLDPIPDHGRLLGNLLRWTAGDNLPFTVEGTGIFGTYLYRQENRLILHLVNATGADNQKALVEEYVAIGPLKVTVKLPDGVKGHSLKPLVSERPLRFRVAQSVAFEIPQLIDHEVVVIE